MTTVYYLLDVDTDTIVQRFANKTVAEVFIAADRYAQAHPDSDFIIRDSHLKAVPRPHSEVALH